MRCSPNVAITPFVLALGVLGTASTASAADIATVVGAPGSAQWQAACSGGPSPAMAPTRTQGLSACSGPEDECLHRVEIPSEVVPNAVCSDGTPGTFYVRPGSAANIDRWVIHLQGGGACRDYEECLQRWCGQQGGVPYKANKMSSDWDGDGSSDLLEHAEAGGMARYVADNQFHDWTHVFVYYCSSDLWMGRQSDVTFSDGTDSVQIDARGHTILTAVRRMLRQQGPSAGWTAVGGYTVPNIEDATEIIFSGTSAGSKGAIANADWFFQPFDTKEALVLDAGMDVQDVVLATNDVFVDTDDDGLADLPFYSYRIGMYNQMWAPGGYFHAIDGFTDQSCRDNYEPQGRMDRCSISSTMLMLDIASGPIIQTPTFVRKDLHDATSRKKWTEHPNREGFSLMIGSGYGVPTTAQDHVRLSRETLAELYDDHGSVTGAIAPRCGKHVGLEDGRAFWVTTTPDTDALVSPPAPIPGTDSSVHDALWDWFNLGGSFVPLRRLDTDEPGMSYSDC